MVPPLTLCAYMKKGPNLRWSLVPCSGGDEGDRTPDLLTASQALSQLSYAPVRRSTIRELGRRCKDIFGKTFRGRGHASGDRDAPAPPAHPGPIRGQSARPVGRPPRNWAIYYVRAPALAEARHESRPSTTFGRPRPTTPPMAKRKLQADGLRFSRNEGCGRGVGSKSSRWPAFVAEASRAANPGCQRAGKRPSSNRFAANCT